MYLNFLNASQPAVGDVIYYFSGSYCLYSVGALDIWRTLLVLLWCYEICYIFCVDVFYPYYLGVAPGKMNFIVRLVDVT